MGDLTSWIGRSHQEFDVLEPAHAAGLAATLDLPPTPNTSEAPPLAHWICFRPLIQQSELGRDGHPRRGGLLPPGLRPRRMWAGGRLTFRAPLRLGATLRRTSTIEDLQEKAGRSGGLTFVTLRHDIHSDGRLALVEHQDLVFRDAPQPGEPGARAAPAVEAAWPEPSCVRAMTADPVLLFRFSALTFNGHRIHYDRDYAREVEGYPSLVVHGPLIATLLMDLFRREAPRRRVTGFNFRARQPLFEGVAFDLCLHWTPKGALLWARDHRGAVLFSADVEAAT